MRLLRVLGLGLVLADERRDVLLRVLARDKAADGVDGLRDNRDAVRSHIGDEADGLSAQVDALVEALGDLHGLLGREPELAGGVHLQRRGCKRRERVALHGLLVDRDDAELALLDRRLDGVRIRSVLDIELFQRGAVDSVEPSRELLGSCRRHGGFDRPVFLAAEGLDLCLAVADEAQRHRLHAPCRAGARQLAPQHGREREAYEVVERPAGEVGGDERPVDLARLVQRGHDRLLRHRVEGDALDLGALLERLLLLQDLQDMPGDRLALAIGVGSED